MCITKLELPSHNVSLHYVEATPPNLVAGILSVPDNELQPEARMVSTFIPWWHVGRRSNLGRSKVDAGGPKERSGRRQGRDRDGGGGAPGRGVFRRARVGQRGVPRGVCGTKRSAKERSDAAKRRACSPDVRVVRLCTSASQTLGGPLGCSLRTVGKRNANPNNDGQAGGWPCASNMKRPTEKRKKRRAHALSNQATGASCV